MGLSEKQAWARLENDVLGERRAALESAVGAPVTLSFDTESFATKELIDGVNDYALAQFVPGIVEFAKDDMARDALRETVKGAHFVHRATDAFSIELKEGKLVVVGNFDGTGMCGIAYPHANDFGTFLQSAL